MHANGKTILITGATSGIGKEAAVMLAREGARIVIVGRDAAKTAAVLAEIKQRSGSDAATSMPCDFASQASIRRLAEGFLEKHERLDVLINNAGGVHARRELTEDGIEATFAVNHLGYFLLTRLLLERLKASAPARIVNVASRAHYRGTLDLDDIGFEHGWRIMPAYARSKLANVLFTRALAQRLSGSGVTVNAVHPGVVGTHIWDHGAPPWARALFRIVFAPVKRFYMRTPEDGAGPIVRLAIDADMEGQSGLYFNREHVAEPSEAARDDALAERLWLESERLVALHQASSR
ncbi:MAG TPA: SDR family oxidoreductase [Oleiagrimonas sp.]|nr:SDR family oxidoreductase [Oleiagrimonas sp.]